MEGYKQLASAIILQATEDYKEALYKKNTKKVKELEDFFLSGWCMMLGEDIGEIIVAKMPKKIEQFRRIVKKAKRKATEKMGFERCPICRGRVDVWFARYKPRNVKDAEYEYFWKVRCLHCGISGKIKDNKHKGRYFDENGKYTGKYNCKKWSESRKNRISDWL